MEESEDRPQILLKLVSKTKSSQRVLLTLGELIYGEQVRQGSENCLSLTIGVPESTHRLSAVSIHTAIAIFVLGFLML